jgi:tryptophanyl-tRNA synthetase
MVVSSALVGVDAGQVGGVEGRRADPDDFDIAKSPRLIEFDVPLLEQFENGQEPDDDLESLDKRLGEPPERHPSHPRKLVDQFFAGFDDADPDVVDVIDAHDRLGSRSHRPQVRGLDVLKIDADEQIRCNLHEPLVETGPAWRRQHRRVEEEPENLCCILESLAVEQSCDQQIALLPERELVVQIDVGILGQETLALQFDKRRRDEEKFGGDIEVEFIHLLDLDEIGINDPGERNLVEIHLFAQDQVKQEVEGPLVDRCLNLVWHRHHDRADGDPPAQRSPGPCPIGRPSRRTPGGHLRSKPMTRVFSGIKPTGPVQLGNLLGALRYWVTDQAEADTIFCVVDLHALTVPQDPAELRSRTLELAQLLLAIGIDPAQSTLFIQSHVPEHTELSWILECTAAFGELRRMTQFKDKSDNADFVSAGLFSDDQRQHLELSRDLAIRFNHRYGDTFVVPEASIPKIGARVMDLQEPTRKMSKSEDSPQGTILVLDDLDAVAKKIKRAVTDTETDVRFDPATKPGVSNLLSILSACTGDDPHAIAERFERYGDLKSACAEVVVETLRPIQQRFAELSADPAGTAAILATGAEKARSLAGPVLERARANLGLLPPA